MLETLRAYGAGLLTAAGEGDGAAAALAGYAQRVAEQAAEGMQTGTAEVAAARHLDAEDATMRQALAWAMQHDRVMALRLMVALAPWWDLRGRLPGQYPLLREAAGRAVAGSETWCAAQFWLGQTALRSADLAGALGHFTAVRDAIGDRPPSRALVDCLGGRSIALLNLGQIAEAADDGRRSLALAEELGYPAGETLALMDLALAAFYVSDLGSALQLSRRVQQIPADIPGWITRLGSNILTKVLTAAGDLAAAERSCAAGLARSRDAGDLQNQARLLTQKAILDLQAGLFDDAAAQLREALQIAVRAGGWASVHNGLECCGYLCAATGRRAEAVTLWAAHASIAGRGYTDPPPDTSRRREPLREPLRGARQALGPARTRAAEDRGAAMSLATAAEYALLLTAPGPQPGMAAAPGAGKLSARERELVTLVAQGRTDAQIAAQLYISIRTVRSHLDRIRDKTGCRRRADLTRLALSTGLL